MALITVDILKNDNPELYEEIKDVLDIWYFWWSC